MNCCSGLYRTIVHGDITGSGLEEEDFHQTMIARTGQQDYCQPVPHSSDPTDRVPSQRGPIIKT